MLKGEGLRGHSPQNSKIRNWRVVCDNAAAVGYQLAKVKVETNRDELPPSGQKKVQKNLNKRTTSFSLSWKKSRKYGDGRQFICFTGDPEVYHRIQRV